MAVKQTFTDRSGVSHPDAYRHIRINNYDHKRSVDFSLISYSSEAFYNEHEHNPLPYQIGQPKRFVLKAKLENEVDANPLYDQYLGNLTQAGKDLMGQLYEYLKNETNELAGAFDLE